MSTTELFVHTDSGGIDALVRLQGIVSAFDISPMGYDREELLSDAGEVACDLIHSLNAWRPTARAKMPPAHELKYAVIRYAKAKGSLNTAGALRQWANDILTDTAKEALGE